METFSYTEARGHLKDLMDRVNEDHVPIRIQRRSGDGAVLMAEADCAGLQETFYLLSSPANAERLLAARRRGAEEAIPWEEAKKALDG
jgi:antitoxin YefM